MTTLYITSSAENPYSKVKEIASRQYNIADDELVLLKNEYGKPYIENCPAFHFNISNSYDLQVIAVSDSSIGVDIEKIRPVNQKVAKRFAKDEYEYIAEQNSDYAFIEIWTKKEAYLKYLGTGIAGGLSSFSVFNLKEPLKTFKKEEYIISVCGAEEFEIINSVPKGTDYYSR